MDFIDCSCCSREGPVGATSSLYVKGVKGRLQKNSPFYASAKQRFCPQPFGAGNGDGKLMIHHDGVESRKKNATQR